MIFTKIDKKHIEKWVNDNKIECLFFNEQHEFKILIDLKKKFPHVKIGSYIDYYTEDTIPLFDIYDFLICNTKRHYSAFRNHKQVYYVKWGTDTEVFKPNRMENKKLTFFHSMGMSYRKGTDILVNTFIRGKLYNESKLIIHTQVKGLNICGMGVKDLEKYNIEVVERTVGAPGLYYLGDVYVYPTTLEGLGLTIYEALACGMPVITTDYPPMNEVITSKVGRLINVREFHARADGYYWPQSFCDEESLIRAMRYYLDMDGNELDSLKTQVREYACKQLDFSTRKYQIEEIFTKTKIEKLKKSTVQKIILYEKNIKKAALLNSFAYSRFCNDKLWILLNIINKRKNLN